MRPALFASVAALLLGCAAGDDRPIAYPVSPRPSSSSPAPMTAPPASPFEVGEASFYSDRLAGHATASGEAYDPSALTAAHRTLPLGSILDVVREDGRAVRVRVNDRGPYADGRVIDLSHEAARRIGLVNRGIASVALWLVYVPPPKPSRRHARR